MNPRVIDVKPAENYTVNVWFSNGERGIFDVKPYLDRGIFRELRNVAVFNSVRPDGLSIEWDNEAALSPDTVYFDSEKI